MGINTTQADGGQRGVLRVLPNERAREYRKFWCLCYGKARPKSWLGLAQWIDEDGRAHQQEMCRKCYRRLGIPDCR